MRRARVPPDGAAPFFIAGSLWAGIAMMLWLLSLRGIIALPGPMSALDWHAHEMIYGFAAAIVVGYLLGIVPNRSARLPVAGRARAALLWLWIAGRMALLLLPAQALALAALVDAAFLLLVFALLAREILPARDWRGARLLLALGMLAVGNIAFLAQSGLGWAAGGSGARAGIAALVLMITLVGGALVPSFTRRWLAEAGLGSLPAAQPRLEALALGCGALALLAWVVWPSGRGVGAGLLLAGIAHGLRWIRWQGWRSLPEPLVVALHAGYGFVVLGFWLLAAAVLLPGGPAYGDALHAWSAGAIGMMTLAVMIRSALRRARRASRAGWAARAILLAVFVAALARLQTAWAGELGIAFAAFAWIGAYAGFVLAYGPMLSAPVPARHAD